MAKWTLCFLFLISLVWGQGGYSSASISMGRAHGFPASRSVIVEEFTNFHLHKIKRPTDKSEVEISMEWGQSVIRPEEKQAILQIGLASKKIVDFSEIPPLNLCLVIDKSGSMSGERITKAKLALLAFVQKLRVDDYISIVAFDHNVEIKLAAQKVGNRSQVIAAIEGIQTGGSTDLNLGLITGYKEVSKNYSENLVNRVIVLTDALTNTGEIEPESISRNMAKNSEAKNIDFTLIGVGVNFNEGMSRQLVSGGRNSIHFIGDAADIKKVFVDEAESLLMPVAYQVTLEIEYDHPLRFAELYGYSPSFDGNKIKLKLNNIHAGLTQVVLLRWQLEQNQSETMMVKANLTYQRALDEKSVSKTIEKTLAKSKKQTSQWHDEVKKNYTIAFMAQSLKNAAIAHENHHKELADKFLAGAIAFVQKTYPLLEDADIKRVLAILQKNRKMLKPAKSLSEK